MRLACLLMVFFLNCYGALVVPSPVAATRRVAAGFAQVSASSSGSSTVESVASALDSRRSRGIVCAEVLRQRPRRRPTDAELFAALLRPVRQLLRAVTDFFLRLRRRISGVRDLQGAVAAKPAVARSLSSQRTIANLQVVEGVATRDFPPQDEVLAYFGYPTSPFYATLPPEASEDLGVALPASNPKVRWLEHRFARPPSDIERASDEGRMRFLRKLFDETAGKGTRLRLFG